MSNTALHIQTNDVSFTVRAAALILSNGRLLVAKSDYHDCYYTVGGVVNANESSSDAVLREVWEETGHPFEIDRLAFIQERFFLHNHKKQHEISFFYLMKEADCAIAEGTQTDQIQEHLHWISLEVLPQVNLVPAFLKTAMKDIPSETIHITTVE